jgi:hypothetical protein
MLVHRKKEKKGLGSKQRLIFIWAILFEGVVCECQRHRHSIVCCIYSLVFFLFKKKNQITYIPGAHSWAMRPVVCSSLFSVVFDGVVVVE